MFEYKPKQILVDSRVESNFRTARILSRLPNIPVTIVEPGTNGEEAYRHAADPITTGKETLLITENKGGYQLRRCPGIGDSFLCCNYYVINVVENCHFECSYCFLQSYLTSRVIKLYVNLESVFDQLDQFHAKQGDRSARIGTGELSDSLGLEQIHGFSADLIEKFKEFPTYTLELKTKSSNVEPILDVDHAENVIISWSINPQSIVSSEELGTATVVERLQAAKLAADAGYRVAFHCDPMIYTPNWEREYTELVETLFDIVPKSSIAWFSMGGLRLNPGLSRAIRDRRPDSALLKSEYVAGIDHKLKYPRGLRETMFSTMRELIDSRSEGAVTYLCMESPGAWENVYGGLPTGEHRLDAQFKDRLGKIEVLKA